MPAQKSGAATAAEVVAHRPIQTLLVAFAAWKTCLLAIAVGSCLVGAAYDTSASLAVGATVGVGPSFAPTANNSTSTTAATTLVTRLTSWDAIYFTQVARRGYLFEQEWAFGTGLPLVIFYLGKGGS